MLISRLRSLLKGQHAMLDLWISQVKARQYDGPALAHSLLSPDPTSSSFNLLRQSLQVRIALPHPPHTSADLSRPTQNQQQQPAIFTPFLRSSFPSDRSLADFLAAFLLYVRDVPVGQTDSASLERTYGLLEDTYRFVRSFPSSCRLQADLALPHRTADRVFAQGETGWFVPTLRKLTRRLIDVALAVRPLTFTSTSPESDLTLIRTGRKSVRGSETYEGRRSGEDVGTTHGNCRK